MSDTIKLLPCPCGVEARFRKWDPKDSSTGWGEITCCNDNCTWQVDAKSEVAAAEMWNKRAGQQLDLGPIQITPPEPDQSKREELAFWERALLHFMSSECKAVKSEADTALAVWLAKKKEMGL